MYIVYDDYGNTYNKMDYKMLKEFLVDEIIRDGINRLDEDNDNNRIKECLKELGNIALNDDIMVSDELNKYGWHTLDILDLHCRLNEFFNYLKSKGVPNADIGIGHVELTLGLIDGEMKYDKRK